MLSFRGRQQKRFELEDEEMALHYLSLTPDKYSVLDNSLITRTGHNSFRFELYLGDLIGLHTSFVADMKVSNTPELGRLSFIGESVRLVALPMSLVKAEQQALISDLNKYPRSPEMDTAIPSSTTPNDFPKTQRLVPPPPVIASSDIYQRALRGENFSSPFNVSFAMEIAWDTPSNNSATAAGLRRTLQGITLPLKLRHSEGVITAGTSHLPVTVRVEAHGRARIPAPRRMRWFLPEHALNSACNVLLRAAMKPALGYFVNLLIADFTQRKQSNSLCPNTRLSLSMNDSVVCEDTSRTPV
jgi:hypothetical protein